MATVILLLAGSGTRLGGETPKQFIKINGKSLFVYPLETFANNPNIDDIVLVVPDGYDGDVLAELDDLKIKKIHEVIIGGKTRAESVEIALRFLEDIGTRDDEIILIHDAARVLVSDAIINKNIEVCEEYDAACTVVPCSDTLFRGDSGEINSVIDRQNVYNAQTPQTFRYSLIKKAHKERQIEATDDAQLLIKINQPVHIVMGSKLNFKVTTSEDLDILKSLLR